MNRFAILLERLADEPMHNHQLRLLADYLRCEADPDRGWALAALIGGLALGRLKPAELRALIAGRTDPALFALGHAYVGDLCEAVALQWPGEGSAPAAPLVGNRPPAVTLSDLVETWQAGGAAAISAQLPGWLDALDGKGRFALLKLLSGGLRPAVSGSLVRAALAALGKIDPREVAQVWYGLAPPYLDLFAWLEGRGPRPAVHSDLPLYPLMTPQRIEAEALADLRPEDFCAVWSWDGLRVQAVTGHDAQGQPVQRLYGEDGDDLTAALPELAEAMAAWPARTAVTGMVMVCRAGRLQPHGVLSQRLARKRVTPALRADLPAHLRVEDLLMAAGEDLRPLSYEARQARLAALLAPCEPSLMAFTPPLALAGWAALEAARCAPAAHGAGTDLAAISGISLRRRDAPHVEAPGSWFLLKGEPLRASAVLMYVQRAGGPGAGLELTLGVWRAGEAGDVAVPIGKVVLPAAAEDTARLEAWVRAHTSNRFGPVREVSATAQEGLVVEIAFAGVHASTRHKAGLVLTRPLVVKIDWDTPPGAADRLERLAGLLAP